MTPPRAPRVTACADSILQRLGLFDNPYFKALSGGSMSRECFGITQQQFFFAVRYFARPMAALIARMPDPAARVDILHNIVEEHGDFREEQFHQNTFRRFLSTIGTRSPDEAGIGMWPAVHAFNNILMAACASDEIEVGVGCLGIIEYAFSEISAIIGRAVIANGWVGSRELLHYAQHAELDVRHADEFFALVEPCWDVAEKRAAIQQGLELGAYAFDQTYRSLHLRGCEG
jgi:pyrroloquinoline-quinone synthase